MRAGFGIAKRRRTVLGAALLWAVLSAAPGLAFSPELGDTAASGDSPPCRAGPRPTEFASTPASAEAETAAIVPAGSGVTQALLEDLHAALVGTPGFIDVHFVLQGAPRFMAFFEGSIPEGVRLPGAPYPLEAASVEAAPAADGSSASAAGNDPPVLPPFCGGVRPGVAMNTPAAGCTLGWIVRDAAGALYAVSAGHCFNAPGQRAGNFGTLVWSRAAGIGKDFSVVRIDVEDLRFLDPAMCHWGGPTAGPEAGRLGDVTRSYGWGLGFGATQYTRPRTGALWSIGATSFTHVGLQLAGDSGAPVRLDSGPALGVHTHGVQAPVTSLPGLKWGTRLSHGLALAEHDLGRDFELVTAALA